MHTRAPELAALAANLVMYTRMAAQLVCWARCQECREDHPAYDSRARDHLLASYTIEPGARAILRVEGHCAQGHPISTQLPVY
jgi:hypothetical protein